MKEVKFNISDVTKLLADKIAKLEQELAIVKVEKQAIVKYAEGLESELESLKNKGNDTE